MNPRVKKILSIEPFVITALWSDDRVRATDFGSFLSEYFQKEQSVYFKVLNENQFRRAKTDGKTIYWENIAEMVDCDGKLIPAPLDFCPDVLLQYSVLVD
ncbi:hypothetical protein [Dyadobacter alkalitolerans]|uniref:hypothetical protein n=1 Tax=Dyadobacter alkalitolerans TaxID=492736 RepID=UPI000416E582|nr:hypothetical protein [Dyadobacter alkalitolerans]